MRPVAPSPPNGPDMDKTNPAAEAVGGNAAMDESLFDPTKNPIANHPNYDKMAQAVQKFMDENKNGIDDRQEAGNVPQGANAAESPQPANEMGAAQQLPSLVGDPRAQAALAPLTEFFKTNGRLPDPEELKNMAAQRELTTVLGREPTKEEVMLFRAKPPKSG